MKIIEIMKRLERRITSSNIAIFVTFLGIVGVIAPIVFPKIVTFLEDDPDKRLSPEMLAVLFAVIILVFGDRLIDIYRHKETTKAIAELIGPASQAITCTYIGTYKEGLEYYVARANTADSIKDTMITYSIRKEELDIYFFDDTKSGSIQKAVCNLIKRGKPYRAVISDNVIENIYKDRCIPEAIENSEYKHLLHVKTVCACKEFPIMNFSILAYGPGEENREVLFGWGHHVHDEIGHVFSTRDRRLVDTFEKLFRSLENESVYWLPKTRSAGRASPNNSEVRFPSTNEKNTITQTHPT